MTTDLQIEIREVRKDGSIGEIIPDYTSLGFQDLPSEPGAVRFTYPRDGRNAALIGHDREYCLFSNGRRIGPSTFTIKQSQLKEAGDDKDIVEWFGRTYLARLEEALIGPVQNRPGQNITTAAEAAAYREIADEWAVKQREKNRDDMAYDRKHGKDPVQDLSRRGDANKDGRVNWLDYRPSEAWSNKLETAPPPASPQWKNATPGKIIIDIIRSAQARGMVRDMTIGFTAYSDSAGRPWSYRVTTAFEIGQTALYAINWLKERGVADATTDNRKLLLFNPSRTTDRSNTITLSEGSNLEDSPFERDTSALVNAVFVESDTGVHGWVTSPASIRAYGRREGYLKVEKIKTWPEASRLGLAYLNRSDDAPYVYTYGIAADYGVDPFFDFYSGDTVGVMIGGNFYKQRITSISVDVDGDGSVKVAATAGGRVRLRAVAAIAASMSSVTGWSPNVTTFSSGVPRLSVEASDEEAPWQPSVPQVTSRSGVLRIQWDGLDADGDSPVFDQDFVEVHAYDGDDDDFEPSDDTLVDTIKQIGVTMLSSQSYTKDTKIKFVAVDKGGDRSEPSVPAIVLPTPVRTEDIGVDAVTSVNLGPDAVLIENLAPEVTDKIDSAASGSDGLKPGNQPTAIIVRPGVRSIQLSWTAITNADPVTYEVWMGTSDSFIPDYTNNTNRVGIISGTSLTVRNTPSGEELDPAVSYYFTVTARDVDGRSEAIHPALQSAMTLKLTTDQDIAADQAWLGTLTVDRLTGGDMMADVVVAGAISTASSGQRSIMDNDGFRQERADGNVGLNLPNGGNPSFTGDLQAEKATLTQGVEIQGTESFLATGARLTLQSGVVDPVKPPDAFWTQLYTPIAWPIPVNGQSTFRKAIAATGGLRKALVQSYHTGNPGNGFPILEELDVMNGQRSSVSGGSGGTRSLERPDGFTPTDADATDIAHTTQSATSIKVALLEFDSNTGWFIRTFQNPMAISGNTAVRHSHQKFIANSTSYPRTAYMRIFNWSGTQFGLIYKRSDGKLHLNFYDYDTDASQPDSNFLLTASAYPNAILRSCTSYNHENDNGTNSLYFVVGAQWGGAGDTVSLKFFEYAPPISNGNANQPEVTSMATAAPSAIIAVENFGSQGYASNYPGGDSGLMGLSSTGQAMCLFAKNIGYGGRSVRLNQAWYDSDTAGTGTHETSIGASVVTKYVNGKYVKITAIGQPTDSGEPDDPNTVRFYATAHPNATPPITAYQRQATINYAGTVASFFIAARLGVPVGSANADGALQPKPANEFLQATASPAYIKSSVDNFVVYGDGSGKWPGLLPPGMIMEGPYAVNPPGYGLCDGSAVSRAAYPVLNSIYAAQNYPYGAGDGSTTFNLPMLIGSDILWTPLAGGTTQLGSPGLKIVNGVVFARGAFVSQAAAGANNMTTFPARFRVSDQSRFAGGANVTQAETWVLASSGVLQLFLSSANGGQVGHPLGQISYPLDSWVDTPIKKFIKLI